MQRVVLVAQVQALPGKGKKAIEALHECMTATHLEPGVLRYALHEDHTDPDRFVMIEVYENMDARRAHGRSEHLAALVSRIGELIERPAVQTLTPIPFGDPVKGALP